LTNYFRWATHNFLRKMTENTRMRVQIVYGFAQQPQDIVDK